MVIELANTGFGLGFSEISTRTRRVGSLTTVAYIDANDKNRKSLGIHFSTYC